LLNESVQLANKRGFKQNKKKVFTKILERFRSKAFSMIVEALWYVANTVIRMDLQMPTVKEEMHRYSSQYSARLSTHPK
jgi:uncharacterized protein YbjQ (UPF0145 family)